MARNYAALPHDYLEEMELLSDEEFGRLCRALLLYSRDGDPPSLSGSERLLWPRAKAQEDRFQASYEATIEQKRQAGRRSAEARRKASLNESERCSTALSGDEQRAEERDETNKTKTETKTETETETIPSPTEKGNARKHPTLEVVVEYARARGRPELAKPFFDYYEAAQWRDAENKSVYNWRQKFISWEMREKDKPSPGGRARAGRTTSPEAEQAAVRENLARMQKYHQQLKGETANG